MDVIRIEVKGDDIAFLLVFGRMDLVGASFRNKGHIIDAFSDSHRIEVETYVIDLNLVFGFQIPGICTRPVFKVDGDGH